jgi:CTP synthase (UTP-ammonia lyase)
MRIGGLDETRAARIIELPEHPFFIATLFQPELSASSGTAHPLVAAFVRSAQKVGVVHPGDMESAID